VGILEFREDLSTARNNAILIKRNPTLQAGIFIKKLPSEEIKVVDGEGNPAPDNPEGKLYRIKNLKPRTVAIETRKDFEEEADWKISSDAPRKHNTSEPFTASGFGSRHLTKDESKEMSSNLPHSTLKSEYSRQEIIQLDSLENLKIQKEVVIREPPKPKEDSFRFRKLTKNNQQSISDEKNPEPSKFQSHSIFEAKAGLEEDAVLTSQKKEETGQISA
jgi:hypothetical protein